MIHIVTTNTCIGRQDPELAASLTRGDCVFKVCTVYSSFHMVVLGQTYILKVEGAFSSFLLYFVFAQFYLYWTVCNTYQVCVCVCFMDLFELNQYTSVMFIEERTLFLNNCL